MFLKLKYPVKLIDTIFKRFHASQDQNQSCIKPIDNPVLIAELRRPEEPLSGAPYPYRKLKETHDLIFSWLSWLAVLLVGAYARR